MMTSDVPTEGQRIQLRYQSVYHPDAEKTEVAGRVDEVVESERADGDTRTVFYVVTDDGRELEVNAKWGKVVVHTDADDNYVDRSLGDDVEWETTDVYEVAIDATKVVEVEASHPAAAADAALDQHRNEVPMDWAVDVDRSAIENMREARELDERLEEPVNGGDA